MTTLHEQLSTLNRDARRARSQVQALWERVTGESTPDGVEATSSIEGPLQMQVDALIGPMADVIGLLGALLDRIGPDQSMVAMRPEVERSDWTVPAHR